MKKLILSSLVLLALTIHAAEKHFSIEHRTPLTGTEGWDCLSIESSTNRLFISRSNHVDVIDLKTEKLVGQISESIEGAHAIGFVPALQKGYVTSGKNNTVVVFDLTTLKVLKTIPAGKKPDLILFDAGTQRLFSFNGQSEDATVIDVQTDKVVGTIALDGKPEFAVANAGLIYVNNEDKNSITVLDPQSLSVKKNWPLAGCQGPSGLSIDASANHLFSTCDNQVLAVTDAKTGKVLQTLPIGNNPDGSVFDDGYAFSSNGSGSLTVIRAVTSGRFEVVQTLPTQIGAKTMAVDPKTHTLYLVAAKYGPAKNTKERPPILAGSVELLVIK